MTAKVPAGGRGTSRGKSGFNETRKTPVEGIFVMQIPRLVGPSREGTKNERLETGGNEIERSIALANPIPNSSSARLPARPNHVPPTLRKPRRKKFLISPPLNYLGESFVPSNRRGGHRPRMLIIQKKKKITTSEFVSSRYARVTPLDSFHGARFVAIQRDRSLRTSTYALELRGGGGWQASREDRRNHYLLRKSTIVRLSADVLSN